MRSNYRKLGDYIELVDERNTELSITTLLGLSISKEFIPSVANTVGTNMKNYKIIKRNQFACSIMQVRRDKKMPVALLKEVDEAIISQAYPVFQVIDENILSPDYLMMWFTRAEFDRQATFWAVGGVRGSLEWDDFLDFELPIPSIEEQRAIVAEYQTVTDRIQLNEQINLKLEETAQALYRHWFVDFEFTDENGKPYKSSGGKMVYNEELEKEVPEGWELKTFTAAINLRGGGTPSTKVIEFWKDEVPFYTPADLTKSYYTISTNKKISRLGLDNCSSKLFPQNTTFITARGATTGGVALAGISMAMNQTCYAINSIKLNNLYAHQMTLTIVNELKSEAIGATFEAVVTKNFDEKFIICPDETLERGFEGLLSTFYSSLLSNTFENDKLKALQSLLLSKMAGSKSSSPQKATTL